jgi:hypothetical protein
MVNGKVKLKYSKKHLLQCHSVHDMDCPGTNPSLWGEKPATNCLSYGTACDKYNSYYCFLNYCNNSIFNSSLDGNMIKYCITKHFIWPSFSSIMAHHRNHVNCHSFTFYCFGY